MTIKTFFNKGIYKSTLKRFYIGSVLYFLMMFMCTGLLLMLTFDSYAAHYWEHDLILTGGFLEPGFLMAIVVPTVVALLVYRFVHSKKASVFAHSMPVTRLGNYTSTLAAAFTLMGLPIILNGVVLMLLSVVKYNALFDVQSCFVWIGVNLLTVFIMFAFSTFVAMLTGNSFAVVALNIFIYIALPLVGSVSEVLLDQFLFGYAQDAPIYNAVLKINPVANLSYMITDIATESAVDYFSIAAFTIAAVLLYIVSFLLYRKRNIETSEDVAAFKVLNPIFKYAVTFVVTLCTFALFSAYIGENPVVFVIIVAVLSAVAYFASEMILRKQIKVWNTYKGFIAFGVVFSLIIGFLMFTNVFGYETYVPDVNDIETAAIYNYYYQDVEPFTDSTKINEYITEIHSELVDKDNITLLNYDTDGWYNDAGTRIHIVYNLKNGKSVTRVYPISNEKRDEIMGKLYQYPEYKYACEEVFRKDVKDIIHVVINGDEIKGTVSELNEFFECVKRDTAKLSYTDLHLYDGEDYIGNCLIQGTADVKSEREIEVITDWGINIDITKKYTETLKWLEDKGYEINYKQVR